LLAWTMKTWRKLSSIQAVLLNQVSRHELLAYGSWSGSA